MTTTSNLEGKTIKKYYGIVIGEVIMGRTLYAMFASVIVL